MKMRVCRMADAHTFCLAATRRDELRASMRRFLQRRVSDATQLLVRSTKKGAGLAKASPAPFLVDLRRVELRSYKVHLRTLHA